MNRFALPFGTEIVADATARDAIPAEYRRDGMLVFLVSTRVTYRLGPGITNSDWVEQTTSGAGAVATGQTTGALVAGDLATITGANTWDKAQSDGTDNQAEVEGVFLGTAGQISLPGTKVAAMRFTTAGGMPANNAPVYLAAAADDAGAGAGKATATPPMTGHLAIVGVCLDNAAYAASKTCSVVLFPETVWLLS